MKIFFLCSAITFLCSTAFSQHGDLVLKSNAKGFYVEHKVAPKEGLFPLSRLYNVHPRYIAVFNNHDFNKGLSIGQLIYIPLTDTNFNQSGNKGVPVYYTTLQKETLANISSKTGKVPLSQLRSWNSLSNDNVAAGIKLIIGFLISNEMQERVVTLPEKKKEITLPPPVEKKEIVQEQKKEVPEKTEPEVKKEIPALLKVEPEKISPPVKSNEEKYSENGKGYFREHFSRQVKQIPVSKEQTVTSSVFKTTSGWQDAKYYLLINGADPGTIVKITNPTNNKVIYAKVLYSMEGIRQNQGLDIRISDAAADALAVKETDKFIVKVNY